jgi:hypothetical protein
VKSVVVAHAVAYCIGRRFRDLSYHPFMSYCLSLTTFGLTGMHGPLPPAAWPLTSERLSNLVVLSRYCAGMVRGTGCRSSGDAMDADPASCKTAKRPKVDLRLRAALPARLTPTPLSSYRLLSTLTF